MPLVIVETRAETKATESLRARKTLRKRANTGDVVGCIEIAAGIARERGKPVFVVSSNAYGAHAWRVCNAADAASTLTNSGNFAYRIDPDLCVTTCIFAMSAEKVTKPARFATPDRIVIATATDTVRAGIPYAVESLAYGIDGTQFFLIHDDTGADVWVSQHACARMLRPGQRA